MRFGAAHAYLDPVRGRPNLAIVADALADRVVVEGGRASGVVVRKDGRERLVEAPLVVLAGGAYGTPAVLLRSGVGPADELRALGVPVVADVPGVGRGLADHPCVHVRFALRPAFADELAADDARGALTHVQSKLKAPSARCEPGIYDLQVLPNTGWDLDDAGARNGRHHVTLIPVLLKPRSTGTVRLRSRDADVVPAIERNFFTDPEGYDLEALAEGVARARDLGATEPVASAVVGESDPGPAVEGDELRAWLRREAWALYHPCCTARLGHDSDPDAVADADGRVRGVDGLRVADASAFPTIPRAQHAPLGAGLRRRDGAAAGRAGERYPASSAASSAIPWRMSRSETSTSAGPRRSSAATAPDPADDHRRAAGLHAPIARRSSAVSGASRCELRLRSPRASARARGCARRRTRRDRGRAPRSSSRCRPPRCRGRPAPGIGHGRRRTGGEGVAGLQRGGDRILAQPALRRAHAAGVERHARGPPASPVRTRSSRRRRR